ncbi:MAG: RNA methyltransferase [Planctomycetes bacterium]|nr:RNA methyltransferase [Planctomycetota bacterium]
MPPRVRHVHFATCAPGLEPVLHAEARALGLAKLERQVGGVYFEGEARDAWRANLHLATAVRVLRRLVRFEAASSDALYEGARALEWGPWFARAESFRVDAHVNASTLDHSLFVAQRVKDAVCDALVDARGARPAVDKEEPDLRLHVHLFKDRCTLLVDTSGDSLHKRGWRRFQGRAPLAETLAAGVVRLSGWDARSPLVDPFCGSGTLLVEAALLACGRAPGLTRERFGFERFPDFDARAWARLQDEARAAARPLGKVRLVGYERDPEVVAGARENLAALGLADQVALEARDAAALELRAGWNAWLVTNPPYGERVGEGEDLVGLYTELGRRLRTDAAGYRLALLSGNPSLAAALALDVRERVALQNGALACELLLADL